MFFILRQDVYNNSHTDRPQETSGGTKCFILSDVSEPNSFCSDWVTLRSRVSQESRR